MHPTDCGAHRKTAFDQTHIQFPLYTAKGVTGDRRSSFLSMDIIQYVYIGCFVTHGCCPLMTNLEHF